MSNTPEPWAGYPDYRPGAGAELKQRGPADAAKALWAAVAILGFVSVGVGFAAPIPLEYAVRLAAAAAVIAAVGLLPRQSSHGWLVVTLATVGFLDALGLVVAGADGGWALVVVLVVDAMQALMAVVALLVTARVVDDVDSAAGSDTAEAAGGENHRHYATGYPARQPTDVPGAARVRPPRAAGALADAAQGSYAAMQSAPAQRYQRAPEAAPGPRAGASGATDPGLPGAQFGATVAHPRSRPDVPGETPPR